MAAPNKQRMVLKIITELSKHFNDRLPFDGDLTVLDHLLLAVIQEEASIISAFETYKGLLRSFFDLNELRVSHPRELADHLNGVPDREAKSRRILDILQFVYETTYTFDLESMRRKPLKQAQKQLSKISGTNSYSVCATVQRALGGHALPIDQRMRDVLSQLTLIDAGDQPDQVRTGLEHIVPKSKGIAFCLLIGALATESDERREQIVRSLVSRPKRKSTTEEAPSAPVEPPARRKKTSTPAAPAKPVASRRKK